MEESRTVLEMESLNLETMDVNELEKRLELALADEISPAVWSCCVDGGGTCGSLQNCGG